MTARERQRQLKLAQIAKRKAAREAALPVQVADFNEIGKKDEPVLAVSAENPVLADSGGEIRISGEALPAPDLQEAAPVPEALEPEVAPSPSPANETPPEPKEARFCRIYGKAINPRIRFIEFEDGTHGRLWVSMKSAPMIGWAVWVKPYEDAPGDWVLHGEYNGRGTRLR